MASIGFDVRNTRRGANGFKTYGESH